MSQQKGFQKDTGYAYMILLSCFLLRAMEVYIPLTFGIYVLEFLEYYHIDTTVTITSLGGLYSFSQAATGPVGGVLAKKIGIRPVVMASTLIMVAALLVAGSFPSLTVLTVAFIVIGSSSQAYVLAGQVVVQQYFDKKRSLASGISMSGASWGFFIWPPLARLSIDQYTWRGSYYIYAGIVIHSFIFAAMLRPVPECALLTKETDKSPKISNGRHIAKYVNQCLFLFGTFLLASGHIAAPVYLPIKAHHQGVDEQKIPFIISAIGLIGIFMRPFSGFMGDIKCVDRLMFTAISLTLSGICLLISTELVGFPALMAIAVVFGIMQSFYSGTTGAQVVDVFTLENVEIGAGLFAMCFGLGICVLNPIAGLLIDLTGTTKSVFYVFGAAHILGGFIFAFVSRLTKHLNKDSLIIEDDRTKQIRLAVSLESINI